MPVSHGPKGVTDGTFTSRYGTATRYATKVLGKVQSALGGRGRDSRRMGDTPQSALFSSTLKEGKITQIRLSHFPLHFPLISRFDPVVALLGHACGFLKRVDE
jgi:hypothetical protein